MSAKVESLQRLREKVRGLVREESRSQHQIQRKWIALKKWFYLLAHEVIKDDVRVRAESLAYLMIFSLLPLVAGFFFLISLFSQVGLVQEGIQNTLEKMMQQIPQVHRAFVLDYVFRFKDLYLNSLLKKSSTLGIFSFSFLVWVGLKVYSNIDSTLNHIWSSERKRPFLEKVRNFIVSLTVAPIVLIAGVSLPIIVNQLALKHSLTAHLSPAFALLNAVVPTLLIFSALLAMYYYLPVEKVRRKSAFWGSLLATLAIQLTNQAIQLYFKLGMETAYGKAAILPILGVWIYFVWLVVILGAEISYLVQHSEDVLEGEHWTPSFYECQGIAKILTEVYGNFVSGRGPLSFSDALVTSRLGTQKLKAVLGILTKRGILVQCFEPAEPSLVRYVAAKDLATVSMSEILGLFFEESIKLEGEKAGVWEQSLQAWFSVFKGKTLREWVELS